MENELFLITARGGSKGVPGKNIRELGGKPLIVYSIETALEVAQDPAQVVVSTDSEEIAAIARKAGANVPFLRPAELATDTASSRDVILHAADCLLSSSPKALVLLLQPTSPFRNPDDVRKALRLYREKGPEMVVSVRTAATNPYYNAYECDADGALRISKGDGLITRRQDAPPVWEFDGSIYVINPEALRREPALSRLNPILPVENTHPHNIDIDTETDFLIAECLLRRR